MSRVIFILIILCVTVAFGQQLFTPPSNDILKIMQSVTEQKVMAHIRYLSHDLLEGRAPCTRGDHLARWYIATQMELMGLKPGGDNGTFFQRIPMIATQTDPSVEMIVSKNDKVIKFKFGSEFIGFSGVPQEVVSIENKEIVFVGYGIVAPEHKWDDYKNVDVKDKVLLMLNNDPSTDDKNFFGGKARTYYGRWTYKYEIAAKKGAIGAIIIHTDESAGYGWNVVESSWSREQFDLQSTSVNVNEVKYKSWITFETAKQILKLAGKSFEELEKQAQKRSFKPVCLGVYLTSKLNNTIRTSETFNVIGMLEGSDPLLKDEAVIYAAHYDHLGIGKPIDGDSIYNGALDNASGVSAMLNIADVFTQLPSKQRRTVLFIALGAEESGLLGSLYYSLNPTFPPSKIAAMINIDGICLFGRTRDIISIGLGKTNIDTIVQSVAEWQGRVVKPDQFPELGMFYRSDQFNFAKIGVPCMYLSSGLEYIGKPPEFGVKMVEEYIRMHYHQPGDEISSEWDLSGAIEDIQLQFIVGLTISNAEEMPRWTKGDEFESIRLKSLMRE